MEPQLREKPVLQAITVSATRNISSFSNLLFCLGQATPTSSAGKFSLTKTNDATASHSLAIDTSGAAAEDGAAAQVSAAEYDPTLDWREDQARRAAHRDQTELADGIGERDERGGTAIGQHQHQEHAEEGGDGEDDDEDLDDMFAVGSRKIKLTASVSASDVECFA